MYIHTLIYAHTIYTYTYTYIYIYTTHLFTRGARFSPGSREVLEFLDAGVQVEIV